MYDFFHAYLYLFLSENPGKHSFTAVGFPNSNRIIITGVLLKGQTFCKQLSFYSDSLPLSGSHFSMP